MWGTSWGKDQGSQPISPATRKMRALPRGWREALEWVRVNLDRRSIAHFRKSPGLKTHCALCAICMGYTRVVLTDY